MRFINFFVEIFGEFFLFIRIINLIWGVGEGGRGQRNKK